MFTLKRARKPGPFRVKLSTSFPKRAVIRQTPGARGVWKDIEFLVDREVEECDAWFVYEGLLQSESTICPPENVVFLVGEPPSIRNYDAAFLKQFEHVISFRADLSHPSVHASQPALPWHIGKTYDELAAPELPAKTHTLSVIASNKDFTAGHRDRVAFVRRLQEQGNAEIFGRGLRELASKWDGLAPYRFSVAIENCCHRDYWTEKLADCFLARAIPFYYGCLNVVDYFPADSFIWLDLNHPDAALRAITELATEHEYKKRLPALLRAKELTLNKYNLFNVLADFCASLSLESRRRPIRLAP